MKLANLLNKSVNSLVLIQKNTNFLKKIFYSTKRVPLKWPSPLCINYNIIIKFIMVMVIFKKHALLYQRI